MSLKTTKGLTALTPEIVRDQTAMGLPLVTYAVFVRRGRLGAISEMPLLSLWEYSVSGMYICM
jgi:hypothetical protein